MHTRTRPRAPFTTGLLVLAALAVPSWAQPAVPDHAMPANAKPKPAVDYGMEAFQPAYAGDRIVMFDNRGPAPKNAAKGDVRALYEVEYPAGWARWLARPLCTYCDHAGDGENAWDYHDHVLDGLPSRTQSAAGRVYWHVWHVQPAYTNDAARNAAISRAYSALLPVQSAGAVRGLLAAKLPDGTALARVVDTNYAFAAPLIRW